MQNPAFNVYHSHVSANQALLAAQLTSTTRGVYGLTGAVIGLAYALRAIGDVGTPVLSWMSPIGWYQAMHPFSGLRWWPAVLLVAASGAMAAAAYAVLAWTAHDYPLDVGARPLDSLPADLPIVFETSILGAALATFAMGLALLGMPRLHHPLERLARFRRVSKDRYWLGVTLSDANLVVDVRGRLQRSGALHVHPAIGASQ